MKRVKTNKALTTAINFTLSCCTLSLRTVSCLFTFHQPHCPLLCFPAWCFCPYCVWKRWFRVRVQFWAVRTSVNWVCRICVSPETFCSWCTLFVCFVWCVVFRWWVGSFWRWNCVVSSWGRSFGGMSHDRWIRAWICRVWARLSVWWSWYEFNHVNRREVAPRLWTYHFFIWRQ